MALDFLTPGTRFKQLEMAGESAMKASLAKGMPHGYEVGDFTNCKSTNYTDGFGRKITGTRPLEAPNANTIGPLE
jgi:hypothetical protein